MKYLYHTTNIDGFKGIVHKDGIYFRHTHYEDLRGDSEEIKFGELKFKHIYEFFINSIDCNICKNFYISSFCKVPSLCNVTSMYGNIILEFSEEKIMETIGSSFNSFFAKCIYISDDEIFNFISIDDPIDNIIIGFSLYSQVFSIKRKIYEHEREYRIICNKMSGEVEEKTLNGVRYITRKYSKESLTGVYVKESKYDDVAVELNEHLKVCGYNLKAQPMQTIP